MRLVSMAAWSPWTRKRRMIPALVLLAASSGCAAPATDARQHTDVTISEQAAREGPTVPLPPGAEGGPCALSHRLHSADPWPKMTAVPHWMPHHEQASQASSKAAWSCGGGVIVFDFTSGVRVTLEPGWGDVPAADAMAGLAEEQGYGRVGEVRGEPALLQEPGTGARRRGHVLVIDGNTLIRVLGNGQLAARELAEITASLEI